MNRKAAGVLLFATWLAGCAGAPTRVETQEGVKIDVGLKAFGALDRSALNDNTVFIRLRAIQGRFIATELATSRLRPTSKDEEILAYVADMNSVLPAYDSNRQFVPTGPFFVCPLMGDDSDKVPADSYHPCGVGSQLAAVKKGESAVRNVLALGLTLGAASAVFYGVDSQRVMDILKDQGIMKKVKEYLSVLSAARAAEYEVLNQDKLLQSKAAPAIRVENNTGFSSPVILPRSIRYSFERRVSIRVPTPIDLVAADPFGAAHASIEARKAELLRNRSYQVICPPNFEQAGFRGKVSCDEKVSENNGSLAPAIRVRLDALYEGVRFPTYEGQDKNLSISIADNAVVIGNLTPQYIEVQSIALYGGKNIRENALSMSLAPASENREPIPLRELCDSSIVSLFTFDGVRKVQLEKRVKFAVAVKYRVGESGNFKTFYGEKNVLLADLVSAR